MKLEHLPSEKESVTIEAKPSTRIKPMLTSKKEWIENDATDAAIEFRVGAEGATFVEPGESSIGVSKTDGEGETLECTSP